MAGIDALTYGAAKKYVEKSLDGVGAVRGKPCEISDITPITGGNRITFSWTDVNDVVHTDTLDVKDGVDGTSVSNVSISNNNHLIITLDNGTTQDAGEVNTVKGDTGDTGKSAYEIAQDNGFSGSEVDWILSLKGEKGDSAYAIALDQGFVGTKEEWIESLKGEQGDAPVITVKTDTSSEYVLQITIGDTVFETPNLKGTATGSAVRLSDLSDILLTNVQNGQVLKYDSALAKFVNVDEGKATQYDTMPNASAHPNEIIQYIGADTLAYKRGYFYRSTPTIVNDSVVYDWVQTDTQPATNDYNNSLNHPTINGNELVANKTSEQLGLQGQLQFETLPTASVNLIGKILQYVGANTVQYKKGFYYQCKYDSDNGTYYWSNIDVSSNADLQHDIEQLKTDRGNMNQLAVAGAEDIVTALNILNRRQVQSYTYVEPNLIINYLDGTSLTISVSSILNETQIGELANVIDTTVTDGDVLQFDGGLRKYKPFALALSLQQLLTEAKDYTDTEIANSIVAGALVCDEKPTYDSTNDIVVYKQAGVTKTTSHTDTRFYYTTNGDSFCTSWINDVEFTFSVASVDFSEYVNKLSDVTSTYTENMLDTSKIPDVAALNDLLDIVKASLLLKINIADIVDNLVTADATKPLSAKQGKLLKDLVDAKSERLQYGTMPTPTIDNVGKIYQYVGVSSASFTNGKWYRCESDGAVEPTYFWVELSSDVVVDDALSTTSERPVQNKVVTNELDTKQPKTMTTQMVVDGNTQTTVEGAIQALKTAVQSRVMQVFTMPTANSIDVGKTVQYLGTTNSTYTQGYFYKCVNNGGTYAWENVPTQKEMTVDGSTITKNNNDVISVPKATSSSLGVVKGGDGTSIDSNGTLKVTGRLIEASSLPTASATYNGQLRLYTGATNSNYTQGQIYKCVASGSSYVWQLFNAAGTVSSSEKRPVTGAAVQTKVNDLIKSRIVTVPNNSFANGMSLADRVANALDSGYKFLCFTHALSEYWIMSQPIYLSEPYNSAGRPYSNENVATISGNVRFTFLEIKN